MWPQYSKINKNSVLFLSNGIQVYKTLEHRMVIAEAAQKLRLPLISKDGEIHEDDIERLSIMSRSSLDSTSTSVTISSSSNSTYNTVGAGDLVETGVGGVPNRFLGITPAYLRQTQLQQIPLSMVRYPTWRCVQNTSIVFFSHCQLQISSLHIIVYAYLILSFLRYYIAINLNAFHFKSKF